MFSPAEWEKMNRKEFHLTGSWMSCSSPFPGEEWTETAHFFANGAFKYIPEMFHAVYGLRDVREAFKEFEGENSIKGRILLTI